MKKTMKALVFTGTDEVKIQDVAMPSADEPDEVLLAIEASGICGSDMHAFHGHDPRRVPPLILGHEFVAVVSSGPRQGQRVVGNPFIVCGECTYCIQGRENLCRNRSMVGMSRPGSMAEYMTIHSSSLIPVPEDLELRKAVLAEPGATALHAVNLAHRHGFRPPAENRTLVIGGGAVGLLVALLLRHRGAGGLTICETSELRRDSLRSAIDCSIIDPRKDLSEQPVWDLVFDCVGSVPTRKLAVGSAAPGGTIVHVGLQAGPGEIDMRTLTLGEISLLGSFTYTRADLHACVNALADGVFGSCSWVDTVSLCMGESVFDDLASGRVSAPKTALLPK